jgi:capsular polysaccharide biosynthesis protein
LVLLEGLGWGVGQWFAPPEPLAWAMAYSLPTSLLVPLFFSLTAVWYALAIREDAPPPKPSAGD